MKKNNYKAIAAVVIIIAILAIASFILDDNNQSEDSFDTIEITEEEIGLNVGDYPPNFTLQNLEEEEVTLYDLQGENVVVNFWASWCPPCQEEMPDLDNFNHSYDDTIVLGVNVRESKDKVKDFVKEGGYEFPILLDKTANVARDYAVNVFPTTYFIGQEGRIEHIKRGLLTQAELKEIYSNYFKE